MSTSLKVAIVVDKFPEVSEAFIINHITGLIDAGVDVKIFASSRYKGDILHGDYVKYNLEHRTSYAVDIPKNILVRIIKGIGLIYQNRKFIKPILRSLNFIRYGKRSLKLWVLYNMSQFFTTESFDIIHCHFGPVGNTVALYKSWGLLNGALVTTFHGFDFDSKKFLKSIDYSLLKKNSDLIIAVTSYSASRLTDMGFSNIIIQPVAINTKKFTNQGHKGNISTIRFLTVGRLIELKGYSYTLIALAEIKKTLNGNFKYNIVGDGPLRKQIESLIIDLDLSDCVKMFGARNQEFVVEMMTESDIFLLNGIPDSEGRVENQGTVIQEAMSMELPVIIGNVGGVTDGVTNGVSGFICDSKNTYELVKVMYNLMCDAEMRARFGRNGREIVLKTYTNEIVTKNLIRNYYKIITT